MITDNVRNNLHKSKKLWIILHNYTCKIIVFRSAIVINY
jgi:hypothetical protein